MIVVATGVEGELLRSDDVPELLHVGLPQVAAGVLPFVVLAVITTEVANRRNTEELGKISTTSARSSISLPNSSVGLIDQILPVPLREWGERQHVGLGLVLLQDRLCCTNR